MQVLFVPTKIPGKETCIRTRNCRVSIVGTAPCIVRDQPCSANAANSTQRVIAVSSAPFTRSSSSARLCSR